jgi:hypothetical protein
MEISEKDNYQIKGKENNHVLLTQQELLDDYGQ